MVIVLVASALGAMLRGEPGAELVSAALDDSAITTVNLSEVAGFYGRRGASEAQVRQLLDPLPSVRYAFHVELAYAVGLMAPATSSVGLSFGDRVCLALARRLGAGAMTADRIWSQIGAAVGVEIRLIR